MSIVTSPFSKYSQHMRYILVTIFIVFFYCLGYSQEKKLYDDKEIIYTECDNSYAQERCRIKFYYPTTKKDYVTVIWFHAGGLGGGGNEIPEYLKNKNIAIASVGYRFSPEVSVDRIIKDCAEAVNWVYKHISSYGGNPNKVILAGYSAGAYLSLMLALCPNYLMQWNIDSKSLYGVISLSGHTITHFAARKERGISDLQPIIDSLAPLYWVQSKAPRILLLAGDRELEMLGRYEENAYLYRMLKLNGNTDVKLKEIGGYGHNMDYPAFPILINQIKEWESNNLTSAHK